MLDPSAWFRPGRADAIKRRATPVPRIVIYRSLHGSREMLRLHRALSALWPRCEFDGQLRYGCASHQPQKGRADVVWENLEREAFHQTHVHLLAVSPSANGDASLLWTLDGRVRLCALGGSRTDARTMRSRFRDVLGVPSTSSIQKLCRQCLSPRQPDVL